jgi:glycosyltransferase involved in cell wall biosynthesis
VKAKRPALAIIVPGGVGTGKDNIGVPVLLGLIKLIASKYDLTIFQLSKINPGYRPEGFELISVYHSNSLIRVLRFPFIFRNHYRQKRFVAVHGFWAMPAGCLAVLVGKLFGIKSIVSVLGGDAVGLPQINYGRLHKPMLRRLTFWTLRNATHANALTKYLVNNLREYGFEREMDIIPWGVDRDLFDYHPKSFAKEHSYTFLHVANLHPVKDQHTLLHAFALINAAIPSRLVIVGSGDGRQKVNDLIAGLQLQNSVTILDPVPYERLAAIYHGADLLLHTSLSEGQCEVVTEAMSCGLPVCGTRVGLMHDLPDCCVMADVRDYKNLADKTIALVRDPVRMNEMRMRAHDWTSHHDIYWTVTQLMSLYGS